MMVMNKSQTSLLLNSNAAKEMVGRLISHYGLKELAEMLRIQTATLTAISNGCVIQNNKSSQIYLRLIKLYCQTKW